MKQSKSIAVCGMLAALSIVMMLLGTLLEIGLYAAPMLAGLCLLPVGRRLGKKYQVLLWVAVSVLSLILVPNVEASLMYLCLFGCYPVIRPWFQRLPRGVSAAAKLVYLNGTAVLVECLVMWVLAPEAMELGAALVLLLLGNLLFFLYDRVLPRAEQRLDRLLAKICSRLL